ncbi:MAG: SRPBCC family protein [Actinomycetota bacterium]|nr:SRPBCC family protein [Actinomycetota bacterium]
MPDDNTDYGQLIDVGGRRVVRFVRRYPVSPTEVWAAITEPDRMARWAFRAEMEPRSGGMLRFDFGEPGVSAGTILEWDKPSVLEYEWATDTETPWRIRFELTSDGDNGTLLTFDHLLPDASNPGFAAGWHWHLDRLAIHLAGSVPADVETDEHFDRLLKRYQANL